MKKIIFAMAALIVAGTSCTKGVHENDLLQHEEHTLMTKIVGDTSGEFQQGSLLVMFNEEMAAGIAAGEEALISGLTERTGVQTIAPALLVQPKNIEVARRYGLHRWYAVSFDEAEPVMEMASRFAEMPAVSAVQLNSFLEPVMSDKVMDFVPVPLTKETEDTDTYGFNDPYAKHQWNLVNTGDKSVAKNAVAGADVGVKDAWKLTAGDPSVVVAVFDCAINNMHEDLKNVLWVNEAEADGESNKDDDGNGFIDDKYGFNFVGCSKITKDYAQGLLDGQKAEGVKGNLLNWTNGSGHGTHVAGIIGAENGNGKGVSSIAGGTGNGDGVRLMSCQIFDGSKTASDAQNAAAFIYAADNGACIAQCSYGNSAAITNDDLYINGGDIKIDGKDYKVDGSPLENAALRYFLDPDNSNHQSLEGNIAIFAAGNHKQPYSSYPGALPYVISVTAFGADFLPGGYTNYGPGSKIAAPGGEYSDEFNYGMMILSTGVSNAAQGSPSLENNKNYVYMQGTSMACPHVSGVAALGISYAKKLGKKFSRDEFQSLLLTSVNEIDHYFTGTKDYYDLSSYTWTKVNLSKYQGKMGTGAVDAWKFLMAIEGTPTLLAQAGKKMSIDISRYCNPADSYTITVDAATKTALGLDSDPVIKNGKLEITCSKVGSGKITLSGSVGKDTEIEGGIGEMSYSRTLSIASRPFATNNGGWL